MKDLAALVVIAIVVWLAAWFVTFEPDMTRWTEAGRYGYLIFTAIGILIYKLVTYNPWSRK